MRKLLVAVAVLGGIFFVRADLQADCGGPTLHVTPSAGQPGTPIVVTGSGMGDACNDVNNPGQTSINGNPLRDVEIGFTAAGFDRTVLGTVDAGERYVFTLHATVPLDAAAGTGSINGESALDVFIRPAEFEVLSGPTVIPAEPAFTG